MAVRPGVMRWRRATKSSLWDKVMRRRVITIIVIIVIALILAVLIVLFGSGSAKSSVQPHFQVVVNYYAK